MEDKRPAMVAWTTVCKPKTQGGLGVLNINVQNNALLLKNLHKFFNKADIPWGKLVWESYYSNGQLPGNQMIGCFWWKANINNLVHFKAMAKCNIGDGSPVSFWFDLWNTHCLYMQLPHLFSFAKNNLITPQQFMNIEFIEDLFHLPLTSQAFQEM